jgi:hypothetical protein
MWTDGNAKTTKDNVVKKPGGYFLVHPNGLEELIHALTTVGDVAPYLVSIANHADGTYADTVPLSFVLTFSEAVTVVTTGGTPSFSVYTVAGDEYLIAYASGTGTDELTFTGTPTGIADGDLVVVEEIVLNGGTIADSVGQDIDVRFPDDYVQPAIVMLTV